MEVKSWSWIAGFTGHVARKKVDWSLLEHGQATIPKDLHERFVQALQANAIPRGGRLDFQIEFEGRLYPALIHNVAREEKYGDTYKLNINGSELPLQLRSGLAECYVTLQALQSKANETRATRSGKNPAVSLTDDEADFVDFFETGYPRILRLEVTYSQGEPLSPAGDPRDLDLDSRGNEPDSNLERFERELDNRLATGNFEVEDSWSRQKVRRAQGKFRQLVRRRYGDVCAICGLDEPILLDAAHLVPWHKARKRRLDPTNGVLLCVLHHRALDRGILSIEGNTVQRGPEATERTSPAYHNQVVSLIGNSLRQPRY